MPTVRITARTFVQCGTARGCHAPRAVPAAGLEPATASSGNWCPSFGPCGRDVVPPLTQELPLKAVGDGPSSGRPRVRRGQAGRTSRPPGFPPGHIRVPLAGIEPATSTLRVWRHNHQRLQRRVPEADRVSTRLRRCSHSASRRGPVLLARPRGSYSAPGESNPGYTPARTLGRGPAGCYPAGWTWWSWRESNPRPDGPPTCGLTRRIPFSPWWRLRSATPHARCCRSIARCAARSCRRSRRRSATRRASHPHGRRCARL